MSRACRQESSFVVKASQTDMTWQYLKFDFLYVTEVLQGALWCRHSRQWHTCVATLQLTYTSVRARLSRTYFIEGAAMPDLAGSAPQLLCPSGK